MTSIDLTRTALAAAERGWHVFPLRPGDKRPAIRDWETRATTDTERIARCWAAGEWNIGIATGPSNLVVIDLDTPKQDTLDGDTEPSGAANFTELCGQPRHGAPPETWTVTTASGGQHLYFTHPSGAELRNTAGKLARLIDTRAHGGYVVSAGSSLADGRSYTTTSQAPVAELPDWLFTALTPVELPVTGPVNVTVPGGRRGAYLTAAIDAEAAKVRAAAEGSRNRTLYCSAVALGQLVAGGALPESDAQLVLGQAAAEAGLWLGESTRTIASGLRAGSNRPRTLAGVGA